jgi:CheY-like chemotaxis protein
MAAELPVGPLVSVSVADDGAGIAPEVWSHLFEPFYTTKGGRGSGLGLAAVYGTVKAHRGGVDVRSAPGQGTTVTLWLPAIPPPAPAAGAAEPAAGPGRRRFLVVDDEPLVRAALDRLLRRGGHEVLLAEGGRAGLEVLARERGRIDAVFLDLMMPDVSGAEVLRLLRADEPELPVIVSSGFAGEGEAERLAGEPGVQVLPKPFSLAELNRVLAAAFPPGKGPLSR